MPDPISPFPAVQDFMRPWFMGVFFAGIAFFIGILIYVFDVLGLATKKGQ